MQLFSVSFDRWKDFLFFQSCLPRVPPPQSISGASEFQHPFEARDIF